MGEKVKYLVVEIDGVDLPDQEEHAPKAENISYDQAILDLGLDPADENVQKAIESLTAEIRGTTAPGFSCGKTGNVTNAYLEVQTVSTDTVAFPLQIDEPILQSIAIRNQDITTFDVEVYGYVGATHTSTLFQTVTVTAARSGDLLINLDFEDSGTFFDGFSVKVTNGSAKNPIVVLYFRGGVI